jgi:hypothetical protein
MKEPWYYDSMEDLTGKSFVIKVDRANIADSGGAAGSSGSGEEKGDEERGEEKGGKTAAEVNLLRCNLNDQSLCLVSEQEAQARCAR